MKSDHHPTHSLCSRGVLAASTPTVPAADTAAPMSAGGRPELLSLTNRSLGPRQERPANVTGSTMRLTERDGQIVELVFRTQALRDDQVQVALFSPGAASRCQRRLTLLVRYHYLDRLPRETVNEPAVYVLSRRSVEGNRLLRERFGEAEFRKGRDRLGPLEHLLAVNDVRVRVGRACRDLDWSLGLWQRPGELAPLLADAHLVPDAYFKVQREVNGQQRTAAFFLELERVGKSSQVLRSKLKRYADLYYSGRYQRIFGTKALRVLFVFAASEGGQTTRRVETAVGEANRLGVTIARFAGLEQLKLSPAECLTDSVWYEPATLRAVALFDRPPAAENLRPRSEARESSETRAE